MSSEQSTPPTYKLSVALQSSTPVVGCQINPTVRVHSSKWPPELPQYTLSFSWYREQPPCSVNQHKTASVQCVSCIDLKIPVKESYHCSEKCFLDAWQEHQFRHQRAAKTLGVGSDNLASRKLRSCGSWSNFGDSIPFDDHASVTEQEGKAWSLVGSSRTYTPPLDALGCRLKLVSVAKDVLTGSHLTPLDIKVTDHVIVAPELQPRCMIWIGGLEKGRDVMSDVRHLNARSFSVLSYNILSDVYATQEHHSYCPAWALAWDFRRQNLLREIIKYDADILCLQEVQSDHFENFFKPELDKKGYSAIYKKKNKEVYTANQYVIDGCATFFRRARFKEVVTFEVEYDKLAVPLVKAVGPAHENEARFRLMKDNVAVVVILETEESCIGHDVSQFRICVANTHVHANTKFTDAKLCQVVNLVNGLESIARAQIPLVICSDLNSLPGSDPYNLIVSGQLSSINEQTTVDPLSIFHHLKLDHSMSLVSAYTCLLKSLTVKELQKDKINPQTGEPWFTNFTSRFSGTLDYIFYSADSLEVEGLLELLDNASVGVALPSSIWPSDHIALMASFRIKPDYSPRIYSSMPPNPWQQAISEYNL